MAAIDDVVTTARIGRVPAAVARPLRQVLVPGRHHVPTRFQARYLRALLDGRVRASTAARSRWRPTRASWRPSRARTTPARAAAADRKWAQLRDVDPASRTEVSAWIVEHRLDPVAALHDAATGARRPWPTTHVLLAARKPEGPVPRGG